MSFLIYPIATEKAVNMIERDNVIEYVVDIRATKKQVKDEFENMFKVKIDRINVIRTPRNTKKAVIKLDKGYKASDIALKLKLI